MTEWSDEVMSARTWGEKQRIMNERRAEVLEKAAREREAESLAAEEYRRKYGD